MNKTHPRAGLLLLVERELALVAEERHAELAEVELVRSTRAAEPVVSFQRAIDTESQRCGRTQSMWPSGKNSFGNGEKYHAAMR